MQHSETNSKFFTPLSETVSKKLNGKWVVPTRVVDEVTEVVNSSVLRTNERDVLSVMKNREAVLVCEGDDAINSSVLKTNERDVLSVMENYPRSVEAKDPLEQH